MELQKTLCVMTKDELKKLDESLAKRETELVSQLEEIAGKNPAVEGDYKVTIPDYGSGDTENANEVSDLDRNFALEQELDAKLRQIRKAREKLKQGTYGTCETCSSSIQQERLKAMPIAHLCIKCAEQRPRFR